MKIYAIRPTSNVVPGLALMTEFEVAMMNNCWLYYPIDLYEFDTFDPQYTLDRHGIDRHHPNAVKLVIEDVKYLMEYGSGIRSTANTTYQETLTL